MSSLAESLLFCLVASVLFISCIFIIARIKHRFDLIDVAWGLVFISIAFVSYTGQSMHELVSVQTLVLLLVIIWGLRLSVHLYCRWEKSSDEDKSYARLRADYAKKRGGVSANMFFRVYMVQAILAVVVSLPIIVVGIYGPSQLTWVSAAGGAVWLAGFLFEAIGDYQLSKFRAKPSSKGKIITSGLWKYTRHPNYFGEIVQWWGIFIIVAGSAFWWLALIGPIVITVLVLFISGIPLTEKQFASRKGWDTYKKQTSIFLPLPPKKG